MAYRSSLNITAVQITHLIASIDKHCSLLWNAILHDPCFQELEARWRSVAFLIKQITPCSSCKCRILDCRWQDIQHDITRAVALDQTSLFYHIYEKEFGMSGGEPFGLIIIDHKIQIQSPSQLQVKKDIYTVDMLAQIAAAAFVPLLLGLHPHSFGVNAWHELPVHFDPGKFLKHPTCLEWKTFRGREHARFVGLVLPHMLLRSPHDLSHSIKQECYFQEDKSHGENYLWGNAHFALATIFIKSFLASGWFHALQGLSSHLSDPGLVTGLPQLSYDTDSSNIILKSGTDNFFFEQQEQLWNEAGLIVLCQDTLTKQLLFYNCASVQMGAISQAQSSSDLHRTSATLSCLLCACRFGHYLKMLGRDKVGEYTQPVHCENFLNQWLSNYAAGNQDLPPEQLARYPLRSANVKVKETIGAPGHFFCKIYLQPRLQVEHIESTFVLLTELSLVKNTQVIV